jgi:hypothetical protein
MILQKSKNISLSFSPFKAYKTSDNKLRFSDGFIFNIFEDSKNKDGNELDVSLKESCNFCRPSNMREDFSYEKGDKFYLSIDRYDIKSSKIIKVEASESLRISYIKKLKKDYILICAINNLGNINQILKQNVFIQDRSFATKKAFQVSPISTNARAGEIISKKYKMEGGFAVCLSSGKVLFVEGIDEFEVQGEKSLLEKEEPEKIIYLVAEYTTEFATLDQLNNDAYFPYEVIRSATLTNAYLEIQEKERDRDSIEQEAPKTGKRGNQAYGKFYIPIYPLRPYGFNTQPKEGNLYLAPYVERYQVLVGSDRFTGPDGEYANPVYDPIELSAKPPLYYIWISSNVLYQDIPLTDEDIIDAILDALLDEEYEGGEPIDLTYAIDKHSVLKLMGG